MASFLLRKGHHARYLLSLEQDFAELFGEYPISHDKNRLQAHYSPNDDLLDLSFSEGPREFDCYFCVRRSGSIRAPGFRVLSFSNLPPVVSQHFSDDSSLDSAGVWHYLFRKEAALDSNLAVAAAIQQFSSSRRLEGVGKKGSSIPLDDVHSNVVVQTSIRCIRFNWRDRLLVFKNIRIKGTNLQGSEDAFLRSPSLRNIIACYSEAGTATRNQLLTQAFRVLVEGMDLLFKPAFRLTGYTYKGYMFPSLAARFMAMEALPQTLEACFAEFTRKRDNVSINTLSRIDGRVLHEYLVSEMPDGYFKYRSLILASRIGKGMANWRSFRAHFLRALLRYYHDFNHVLIFRNQLVHDFEFFAEEYYINALLQLFRSMIRFRIAVAKMADVHHIPEISKQEDSADAAFALCIRLLFLDADAVTSGERSFWLNSRTLPMLHRSGWGGWQSGLLHQLARRNGHQFDRIIGMRLEDIQYRVAGSLELI